MILQSIVKLLRYLMWPSSLLYGLVLSIRNLFFDTGIFESTAYDIPVIAVGNLSVGGTGKTPQIEYFIRLLQNDYNIAVLSRGYKRKSEGFVLADESTTVAEIGDEPFQFFQKFNKIKVAVDADRRNGIEKIKELVPSVNLILLDDAFQHRKVKAGFYTLLTSYDNRYTKDFVLPTGDLRETRGGAKRADVIIVTKCPKLSIEEQQEIISEIKPKEHQKVFFSAIAYDDYVTSAAKKIDLQELKQYEVLLVTGIAKPKPLKEYLSRNGIQFKDVEYPDHHDFTEQDVSKINSAFSNIENPQKIILTTEKDATRLSVFIDDLYVLGIKTDIQENASFDNFVKEKIKLS